MAKIKRNAPCPCGSGRKYKVCCGSRVGSRTSSSRHTPSPLKGFRSGIRMKGGVRYDEDSKGYVAIVDVWDNIRASGEPREWRAQEIFPTEEAAMQYYKTTIRPELEKMQSGGTVVHRRLK